MTRRIRRLLLPVIVLFISTYCSSPTEPRSDFDVDRWPYVVSPAGVRVHGTSRILVIPARFADGPRSPLSGSDIAGHLFAGANGGALGGTFHLASGGSFTLRGEVTDWVTTTITREASSGPGTITASGFSDYVITALQAVDRRVDFGRYDNDGPDGRPNSGDDDGVVDGGVVILHSEPNIFCDPSGRGTHPFANTRWRPNGARFQTQDAARNGGFIEIGAYTAMSAMGCLRNRVQSNVIAHELGHLLFGLPDLYRIVGGEGPVWSTRHWVVGCWDLMAAGPWGCGTGAPPTQLRHAAFGAWARLTIGWVEPEVVPVHMDGTYDLHPLGRGGTVLRLPITADEYLLLEYREAISGDEIPPASGVLIYHIAESQPLGPATAGVPSRVRLIEADDDSALERTELDGGNRGVAGDAFGISRFAFRPGEHSRAVALDGTPLPFEITEITIDVSGHRARVRVSPTPVLALSRR